MIGLTNKIRTILDKLEITKAPIDLEKVADYFNVTIIPYGGLPDDMSGFITDRAGYVTIAVNENHSEKRRRFSIAHELGHFFLGHNIEDKIPKNIINNKPINQEVEANHFASELLMPKDFLSKDIEENKNNKINIPFLANLYNVSEQAMSIRLIETGLLNKL